MPKTRRATPLKHAMLDILAEHHLLSASQILDQLHQNGHSTNKTSVYRNLEIFLADNVICQQSLGGDSVVYELQQNHHDHLRCTSCGKIEKMSCPISLPAELAGYTIEHHHLTLFGLCHNCQT